MWNYVGLLLFGSTNHYMYPQRWPPQKHFQCWKHLVLPFFDKNRALIIILSCKTKWYLNTFKPGLLDKQKNQIVRTKWNQGSILNLSMEELALVEYAPCCPDDCSKTLALVFNLIASSISSMHMSKQICCQLNPHM